MESIIDRCSNTSKNNDRVNLKNNEEDIIRNIIHKETKIEFKKETPQDTKVTAGKEPRNYVTLDELFSKYKKSDEKLETKAKQDYSSKGTKKVKLDDIVPKVSLASIGKKR
jgi:hypothetical protein